MTTKEKLLELFEAHKGTFFSGEDIAKNIGCSRTAVWKAVQGLRNDGYNIEAVPNKGYSLAEDTDIVSAQGIQKYLKPLCTGLKITVLPVVDSTNTYIREHVTEELADGYTVLANKQTSGRHRRIPQYVSAPPKLLGRAGNAHHHYRLRCRLRSY